MAAVHAALFMGVLYQHFSEPADGRSWRAECLAGGPAGWSPWTAWTTWTACSTASRVTWVAADGDCALRQRGGRGSTMENHADREEIREAMLSSEAGTAVRLSCTLSEQHPVCRPAGWRTAR